MDDPWVSLRTRTIPGRLMPRTIREVLEHADELAHRFETHEFAVGDERPVEEYLVQRAVIARARSEQALLDAVTTARANGMTWQLLGELLGTSAQAAHQRYGALVDSQ
jgi:hypothetical protein